jgi:hypothetical protein
MRLRGSDATLTVRIFVRWTRAFHQRAMIGLPRWALTDEEYLAVGNEVTHKRIVFCTGP